MIRKSTLLTIIGLICLIGGIVLTPATGQASYDMETAYISGSTHSGDGFMGSGIGGKYQEVVVDTTVPNEYYETLYAAFLGGEDGSALYVVLILLFTAFLGIHLINSANVVIEAISGLAGDLPSLVGSAIVGVISDAYSFGKNILGPANKGIEAIKSKTDSFLNKSGGDSKATPLDKFGQAAEKTTEKTAETAGKVADQGAKLAGNAMDKGAQVAGTAVGAAGSAAGKGLMSAGSALSGTVIGAIIGIPLIVAGAAVTAAAKTAEYGIKAAGKAAKYATIAAGKAAKYTGKAASHSLRTARKTAQKLKNRIHPAPAQTDPPKKRRKYRRKS